ncbi:MAG: restriction endonuclease subunit S, partial [Bacteroidaceae bacterium]|nr:restriction endonuclease subunit S [Bacteroidaceae bacterium]
GWKIEKLGNVANISTGKCNREDAEEDGQFPLFDRSQEIKKSSTWIKDCEAIIVPGEGTTFMPRYYKGKFNLHQRCYCVEPIIGQTGKFLLYTMMINRAYFLSVATGATVPSLRQNNFTKMRFLFPSIELVQKYDDFVSKCFEEIDFLKLQNQTLTRQRDLLLPRLMSGKLEVKASTDI